MRDRRSSFLRIPCCVFRGISADGRIHLQQAREQGRNFVYWNHVGSIAQGAIGLGMSFKENAVGACGKGGARQHRSELTLAAGFVSPAARQLDGMRRVKYHRETKGAHDRDRAHVRNKVVVSERRAAFGDEQSFAASLFGFIHDLRSEEHTSELQSHSFISYAVFWLKHT